MGSKIKYICMYCNKKVVLGEHVCPVKDKGIHRGADFGRKKKLFSILKKIGVVIIASLLIYGFLYRHIGYYSLLLMVLFIVFVFLMTGTGKKPFTIRKSYYKALLRLTSQDRNMAERLIKLEFENNPSLKRNECIRNAYEKLLYDRTR